VSVLNYSFQETLVKYQDLINEALEGAFKGNDISFHAAYGHASAMPIDMTMEAALYSLMAGGKRIRPVLMLSVSDMLEIPVSKVMPFACAIEMIHTYSLIHDDLPCMDNDDTRRGMPTCHVKYPEPIALLAGDALLNRAYEIMLNECLDGDLRKVKAAAFLAGMAGANGMIGGQTMDLLSEGKKISYELLMKLHRKKTGCLLTAPVIIPVILHSRIGDSLFLNEQLTEFADHIGLAFQIKDDLLDVTSTKEILGKSIGKDAVEEKSTFVTLYGLQKAQELLQKEMDAAHDNLVRLRNDGYNTRFLEDLNNYLLVRNK